jgi:hypothetical protein
VSDERERLRSENLRAVRLGHGANCSSIGSVVDTLFASAVVGGAVLAAVIAAMKREPVALVGSSEHETRDPATRDDANDEEAQ